MDPTDQTFPQQVRAYALSVRHSATMLLVPPENRQSSTQRIVLLWLEASGRPDLLSFWQRH